MSDQDRILATSLGLKDMDTIQNQRILSLEGRLRDIAGTLEAHMKAPGRHLGYEDDTTNDDRIAALEATVQRQADAIRVLGQIHLLELHRVRTQPPIAIDDLRALFGLTKEQEYT